VIAGNEHEGVGGAGGGAGGGASLVLEPPADGITRRAERRREVAGRYRRTYDEYAAEFGLTAKDAARRLKRYVEKGRQVEPHDLPPFDEPQQLAAWWRRMLAAGVIKWKVPDWIELLEQVGGSPVPAADRGRLAVAGEDDKPAAMPPEFVLPELGEDAGAAERQLWSFAQGFLDEMERASKARDSGRWFRAWGEYQKILKEIRAWQKSKQQQRLATGEVLEAEVELQVLASVFGNISQAFTRALFDLGKRLRPDLDDGALRAEVLPLRDRVFAGLKEGRFAEVLPAA
jgi:hypothetical protein